jgi:carboxymethylenebutenolidase
MNTVLTAADGHSFDCWMEPAQGPARGGLVILQEIFGVTDQLKGVARRYAAQGLTVAIPALFDRQKRGAVFAFDQGAAGRELMMSSKLDETMLDVAAAVAALKAGDGKVAVMGFCWGGGLAIRATQVTEADCGVAFYGTRINLYLDKPLERPVLGHFGLKDDHTPPELLEAARTALPRLEVHMYDAGHAFANDARPAAYNQAEAELAHDRSADFLARHLA